MALIVEYIFGKYFNNKIFGDDKSNQNEIILDKDNASKE